MFTRMVLLTYLPALFCILSLVNHVCQGTDSALDSGPEATFSGSLSVEKLSLGDLPQINEDKGTSLDEMIAPNSYHSRFRTLNLLFNMPWNKEYRNLRESAKPFDLISPTMVFDHFPDNQTIVKWKELEENHVNGHFNNFVKDKLEGVLKSAKKLVIVTHGFTDGSLVECETTWVTKLAQEIGKYENENGDETVTLALCWNAMPIPDLRNYFRQKFFDEGKLCYLSSIAEFVYFDPAATTGKIGEFLAKMISAIQTEYPNIEYVHGIGHSLGAHIMGNIFNFGGVKIDRISGMDPAGPCFEGSSRDINIDGRSWGLTKESAHFVDNLHTDGEYFGTFLSRGHIDIFAGDPNQDESGAGIQPTCSRFLRMAGCCHNLSHKYYMNSIDILKKPNFLTAYETISQDERKKKGRTIKDDPFTITSPIYAGYHFNSSALSLLGELGINRMFLPIFMGDEDGKWHATCDKEIFSEDQKWCERISGTRIPQPMKDETQAHSQRNEL